MGVTEGMETDGFDPTRWRATFWAFRLSSQGFTGWRPSPLRSWSPRTKVQSVNFADSQAFELFLDVSTMLGAAVHGTQHLVLKGHSAARIH